MEVSACLATFLLCSVCFTSITEEHNLSDHQQQQKTANSQLFFSCFLGLVLPQTVLIFASRSCWFVVFFGVANQLSTAYEQVFIKVNLLYQNLVYNYQQYHRENSYLPCFLLGFFFFSQGVMEALIFLFNLIYLILINKILLIQFYLNLIQLIFLWFVLGQVAH